MIIIIITTTTAFVANVDKNILDLRKRTGSE
jgi:hypothetical protein